MKLEERLLSQDLRILKLATTTFRNGLDADPLIKTLFKLYKSKSISGRPHVSNQFLATLVDSCCTHTTTRFMLSYKIFISLIKNNSNMIRKTCSFQEYKLFMAEMKEKGILKVEEAPSNNSENKKAGIYTLELEEVSEYIKNKEEKFNISALEEAEERLKNAVKEFSDERQE